MITAVSLNPSIDRTQHVASLQVGGLNRIVHQIDAAAGKGVNVALACSILGEAAECIGFMYNEGSSKFTQRLSKAGVTSDFIMCDGAVRVNTKVLDLKKGEITEFNTSGETVPESKIEEMTALMGSHASNSDIVILSGSTPPGCPIDYYRTLTQTAKAAGTRVILDADGERLRYGLEAAPYLIKPNRYELELLIGKPLSTVSEVLDAAMTCIEQGVKIVVVSMGAEGSLITDGKKAWRAYAPKLDIVSTVAAGDSMIAGLACALTKDDDLEYALKLGTAAASIRCVTDPNEMIAYEACSAFLDRIVMERLM